MKQVAANNSDFAQLLALYYTPVDTEEAIAPSCYALGAKRAALLSKLYASFSNLSEWQSGDVENLSNFTLNDFAHYTVLKAIGHVNQSLVQDLELIVALSPFTYRATRAEFLKLSLVSRTLVALEVH